MIDPRTYLIGSAAVVLAVALVGSHRWAYNAGSDKERDLWLKEQVAQQAQARADSERERQREDERRLIAGKVAQDAQKELLAAQGDAAAARTAGERLRTALALARAASCAPRDDTPAAAGSTSADASERLFADVQRRIDEAQEATAGFADAAHRAGRACERIADSLSGESP